MNKKSMTNKISILSTDEATIKLLELNFSVENFTKEFLPATITLAALLTTPTEVLILDEQNPFEMSPIDLCKFIRTKNEEVIIIILANTFNTMAKILALDFKADDYCEKPVNPLEIAARIKVILNRIHYPPKVTLTEAETKFNDLYLDSSRRLCVANGNEVNLTNNEFSTLFDLVKGGGKPVSRTLLLMDVWGLTSGESARPVDDVVRKLRKKLKANNSLTQIAVVWGYGYKVEG